MTRFTGGRATDGGKGSTMTIDWQSELDASISHGVDRPAHAYLPAGRVALRRRRTAMGASAVAAALVVGGLTWAAAPGRPDAAGVPVATSSPAPTATTPETRHSQPEDASLSKEDPPATAWPGEGLVIRSGATVHERRDDLYPGKDTESAALDLTFAGERWWIVLEWDEGGSSSSYAHPGEAASFDEFVSSSVAEGGMTDSPVESPTGELMDKVSLSPGGELTIADDVRLVREVDNPDGLDPPRHSTGLVVEFEGETHWIHLRSSPQGAGGAFETAAESGWLTFDQWLADDVALQSGQPRRQLARIDDAGAFRPGEDGVEILDQTAEPDIPQYVAPSALTSGVAMVRWQDHLWFVLTARYDGEDAVSTFASSKAGGAATIEEFLEFARARYDEEVGLR